LTRVNLALGTIVDLYRVTQNCNAGASARADYESVVIGSRPLSVQEHMSTVTALWFELVDVFGIAGTVAIVVYAASVVAMLALLAYTGLREVQRAVRYRRVARELERTHQAAYRERFGARGRLA
jgi:hypothetical protein